MAVLVIQALGALAFLVGSMMLGRTIRRRPEKNVAEASCRVSHSLFWMMLVLPGMVGLCYPGLVHYDDLLGISSLPHHPVWLVLGLLLLCVGLALMVVSNRSLIRIGRGAAAFLLTERLVSDGVYGRTRNPMSLGFYASCAGLGMIAGSVTVTLGALFIILPIHVFNLKYFEETELALRYGPSYIGYKRGVPFLLPSFRDRRKANA
jgi:protein-S-isoprenylcysteine O-methyltransferase Ste14